MGNGKIVGPNQVQITGPDGKSEVVEAKNIVIATGSDAFTVSGLQFDEQTVISSTGALSLKQVPKKMVVIGGGVIGLELGSVWSRLGAEVTVVEFQNAIGAGMDSKIANAFHKILAKQGIKFRLGTKFVGAEKSKDGKGYVLSLENNKDGSKDKIEADVVLVSVGRKAFTDQLGLESVGVKVDDRGRVLVDKHFTTNVPSIRAIGDVIRGPMLAHKAEEEGIAVAELLAGGYGHVNYEAIPSVVYTHPEVAWCGKTEEELKAAGVEYAIGSFPFMANSRAKTNGMQ